MKGIESFIDYWESLFAEDITSEYRRRHEHLIHYWKGVKLAMLQEPLGSRMLRNGFWPRTQIFPILEDRYMENGELQEEFGGDTPFVGCRRDRPVPSFRVGRDVYAGYFLILYPSDRNNRPFWIARAISDVNAEPVEHPNCILIQY
jgi:hypothetical protein